MIKTGLEAFLERIEKFRKRKVALIANQTSVTSNLEYSWSAINKMGVEIRRIFTPEHGLFSTEQDQAAVIIQPEPGCEIISLYGTSYDSLVPDEALLDGIDLVLFDIQDVGSRYYTYVNTMALFMRVLHKKDIEIIILDRPNPLGGERIEGPMLNPDFRSFVGVFPVTVRHGLTPGELALLIKDVEGLDINLSVMKLDGWERDMLYRDTGLQWIPPSPNMPSEITAYLYPGMCLVEGLNLSEGRGTALPFQLFGADFIEPQKLAALLNSEGLEGVYFREIFFKPIFHKYAGKVIGGIFIHVTDVDIFLPFKTGIAAVRAVYEMYGDRLVFSRDVYEFNNERPAFDLLAGNSKIREMILGNSSLPEISDSWLEDEKEFAAIKGGVHLY